MPMARTPRHEPRKLPQQLRARATVDAIFEAAMQVLAKAEADQSVQSIADRAGVSVGSLYQYFPSKQSLVSALIGVHLRQRVDDLKARLEGTSGLGAEQAARQLVEGLVAMMRPRMRIELAMMRAFAQVGDLETLTSMDAEMIGAVEQFLKARLPELRPVDPALAAFIVTHSLRSSVLLALLQCPERLNSPDFVDELTHLVVSYLRPTQ
ncbi:MAG: TetR/AcrR family transcriptional regulator [Myxococcales bacterium]|nr:TetR/AcrR family transcriptional regulator [Myxococcales bacterium]